MRRRDYPVNRRLTEAEVARMRNILAMGPLHRQPVDAGLERKRWVEAGDHPDDIWPTEHAAQCFYDERGRVKQHWTMK